MTGERATPGTANSGPRLLRPRIRTALRAAGLALLVAIACVRVARTWAVFSATADESQHVAAGIEWWGRTDVVQHEPWRTVNPPVARIAVGLGPFLAGTRSMPFLRDTLYTGPGYERNLRLARPGILPFLALAIVLTWVIARRAYGEAAAWIAAVVVSCLPAILGHAGLATTDVAFTATFLVALVALLRWLEQPTWRRALLGGLALGLAAATKFSVVVLPAFALVAAVARRSLGRRPGTTRRMLTHAPVIALCAFAVVWAAYRFSFAAPAALWQPAWLDDTLHACLPSEGRRHAAEWLLAHRLPAPAAFLALFELCGQEAPGRSTSYLLGQLSQDGFPAFFLIALAVKTPLPVIALAAFGFVALFFNRGDADARFRALAPALAAAVFVAAVIPSRHNIGVRHVLPVMALVAVLAAHGAMAAWRSPRWRGAGRFAAGGMLLWIVALPFAIAPDYFPWFNALAGKHPEHVLIDSDLDWGQDLFRLQRALRDRQVDHVSIAYFGASDLCRHPLPRLTWLRPRQPVRGWIAISQTFRHGLDGSYYRDGDPCDRSQLVGTFRPDTTQYDWLDAYQPVARVGASILLYDVP
jgi:4-amino-4-deoxy-L-arabinose transferase-like glycosyltransferase